MFQITIHHRGDLGSPLYSLSHLWEHLFADCIGLHFHGAVKEVSGSTTRLETIINVEFQKGTIQKSSEFKHMKDIVECIKLYTPTKERIFAESRVLDSEIASLGQLYCKKLPAYSQYNTINKIELIRFRDENYNWEELTVKQNIELQQTSRTFSSPSPQEMISKYRQKLIDEFFQSKTGLNSIRVTQLTQHSEEYKLELLVLKVKKMNRKNELITSLSELDSRDGLLNHFKRDFGYSYIFWPSFEKEDYWMLLMCARSCDIKKIICGICNKIENGRKGSDVKISIENFFVFAL